MKLLFNLEIVEGNRIRARPSDHLKSLPHGEQRAAAEERDNQDPQARAEAEIGIATAQEFIDKLPPLIFTGDSKETSND